MENKMEVRIQVGMETEVELSVRMWEREVEVDENESYPMVFQN